ncbi:MAG: hypothetical protein IKE01_02020 [Clostridia bacterium]|nr:hypothetical protein [Clostridia bacterium]
MKLNGIRCKSCGASIKIKEGDKNVTCPYCNNTYTIDDENKNETSKTKSSAQINKTVTPQLMILLIMIPIIIVVNIAIIAGVVTSRSRSVSNKVSSQVENSKVEQKKEQEKRKLQTEVFGFNMFYSSGTKIGGNVGYQLDHVITSNKTNKDRAITVKYQETQTTSPDEILQIKKKLKEFDNYEVILNYDDDGFVKELIVEEVK